MAISAVDPNISSSAEQRVEESIRPSSLGEIVGRDREKQNIQIMIESAEKRSSSLDHILFHGPPGLGKTSFAMVISKELGVSMFTTTGPAIGKAGDLASILTNLEDRSILFIDEIHRIRPAVEEILYPAMEDQVLDLVVGKGPSARTIRLDLPRFTIIGATTKLAMLSAPLRDRFGVDFRLDFYSEPELKSIVHQKARKMDIILTDEAAAEIAARSRMTARIAIRILKRVRDISVVEGIEEVDLELIKRLLDMLEIDDLGLDQTDRQILHSLVHKFSERPVGLSTLAASISSDQATIEDVYEPFLLRKGLIERTPRGRIVTNRGRTHVLDSKYDHQI